MSFSLRPESARCHRLKSLSVIGGFQDGLEIQFADGLNCIIGHRGTGKTTILEFVRYALHAFPPGDAGMLCKRRVESLVKRNLGDGRIRLSIETRDGLEYIIDRTVGGNSLVLTADGQPTDISIHTGGIFGADIFSQNEVENIADSPDSQLTLIDTFVSDEMAELESSIVDVRDQLQANAKAMVPIQNTLSKLADELTTLPSIEDRIGKLSDIGGDHAQEMNEAQNHKALRDRETRAAEDVRKLVKKYSQWFTDAWGKFNTSTDQAFSEEILNGPNGIVLAEIQQWMHTIGTELDTLFSRGGAQLKSLEDTISEKLQYLSSRHNKQELAFRDLMARMKEAQGLATERAEWERKRNDLLNKKRQYSDLQSELSELQQQRENWMDQWTHLRDRRFQLRQSVANQITESISSPVQVRISQDENREQYVAFLTDALRHAGLHHKAVASKIAQFIAPSELVEMVRRQDSDALQKQANLNDSQAEKILSTLNDLEILLQIETVELIDLPRIELHDGDTWKDSLSLSTGQKCTTILPILLLESENPLLVDQPEDNLDNRFIYDTVVESIHRVKTGRQLILITHNPNIPVLGDAERVFVLTSDGARSWILNQGSVDDCKHEIINLLEGGEEAFAQRRQRYACV